MKNEIINNIFEIINNSEYKFYNTLFNAEDLRIHSEIKLEIDITNILNINDISKILLDLILQKILYTYNLNVKKINVKNILLTENILFCNNPLKHLNINYNIIPYNAFLLKSFYINENVKFCNLENYIYDNMEIKNNKIYFDFPVYKIPKDSCYELFIIK
jgi:hypothetical protein